MPRTEIDVSADVTSILLHYQNLAYLFPEASDVTVTLTAGLVANVYGAWAEIVDSGATTLSSKFAAQSGFLSEVMVSDFSVANEITLLEIAYGTPKVTVGRAAVRSDWTWVIELLSEVIPAGETVYYRAMAETGGATMLARFRYYYL